MTPVRTRFAPSPTGRIHLGNLRIAVFNHLFTRHHGGAFVLRIEDTDAGRTRPGALEQILDDLRWAGIEWDEGPDIGGPYGPYRQSEREALHRTAAERLLAEGRAYRCDCSDERIEVARSDPDFQGPGCPGGCRDQRKEVGTIRFAVPDDEVEIVDAIRGEVRFHGRDVGDFVLLRADGRPTYNLAVVVDDIAMEITHVIRGAGHLSNTPKHHLLFEALGAVPPVFAHLPTVLGDDRKKLSKRADSASVGELRDRGFHPDGVVNYLSLLGWSPGDDREVLTREELIESLTLERVGASDTVFDPEKLLWCSEQHIQQMPVDELVEALRPHLPEGISDTRLPLLVDALRTRLRTFDDIRDAIELIDPPATVLAEGWGEIRREGAEGIVHEIREELAALEAFEAEEIGQCIRKRGKEIGARGPGLFHPVRLALMGTRSGPDMGKVMAALGREKVLARLTGPSDPP